jgi:hypothetical protein
MARRLTRDYSDRREYLFVTGCIRKATGSTQGGLRRVGHPSATTSPFARRVIIF